MSKVLSEFGDDMGFSVEEIDGMEDKLNGWRDDGDDWTKDVDEWTDTVDASIDNVGSWSYKVSDNSCKSPDGHTTVFEESTTFFFSQWNNWLINNCFFLAGGVRSCFSSLPGEAIFGSFDDLEVELARGRNKG